MPDRVHVNAEDLKIAELCPQFFRGEVMPIHYPCREGGFSFFDFSVYINFVIINP